MTPQEITEAHDAAPVGETVDVQVCRFRADSHGAVDLANCDAASAGMFYIFRVRYSADQISMVRGIPKPQQISPRTGLGEAVQPATARIRILALPDDLVARINAPRAELLDVPGGTPREAEQAAPGVDFANLEDVGLAGQAAISKVVEFSAYRSADLRHTDSMFAAGPCDGGFSVKVDYGPEQRAAVEAMDTSVRDPRCSTLRVELESVDRMGSWRGRLVSVH